ncbi:MAG: hypothetical protein HY959_08020 [Ignavibacteriae bacterium]|nr:hypothetical protein [Ignavibacteriota bacterium]
MHKQIIFFLLVCFTTAFPQVQSGNSISTGNLSRTEISKPDSSSKSGFFNFFPGIFSSANGEIKLGPAFLIGLQFEASEIISIGIDLNFGFSKKKYYISEEKYTIIQFEVGPNFDFYKENKTTLFAAPKIGFSLIGLSEKNQSYGYLGFSLSFEAGFRQEIIKELSLTFKLRGNSTLAEKSDISNSNLFLYGGLSLKF